MAGPSTSKRSRKGKCGGHTRGASVGADANAPAPRLLGRQVHSPPQTPRPPPAPASSSAMGSLEPAAAAGPVSALEVPCHHSVDQPVARLPYKVVVGLLRQLHQDCLLAHLELVPPLVRKVLRCLGFCLRIQPDGLRVAGKSCLLRVGVHQGLLEADVSLHTRGLGVGLCLRQRLYTLPLHVHLGTLQCSLRLHELDLGILLLLDHHGRRQLALLNHALFVVQLSALLLAIFHNDGLLVLAVQFLQVQG
mmetsp:Transcript_20648/g.65050  ORF Transcript_20648/g.65050 Transcript_20648/m.65050 type:complete len:249 (+) Transcript_20648:64-810(+)